MTTLENANEGKASFLELATIALAIALAVGHIWMNTFGNVSTLTQNGFHYAGFALLCALAVPVTQKAWAAKSAVQFINIAFGVLVAVSAIYLVFAEDAIYDRGVRLSIFDWIAGAIVILGAIEFTRRTTGWIIPSLIIIALTYAALWGQYVPGVFKFPGLSEETLLFRSIYGDDAIFGNIARISSTFVFLFIIFGAFLLKSGAGDFIIDLARAIAGKMIGGPGFVAVIASGLTGTISGSAVANTAFAGGVEAASSTGGQLMPPIMGAGAFVMAATTQIPYTTIISVSFLPALLYFATVAFFVRIEAKRSGATAMMHEEQPPLLKVLREGGPQFILPVALLIRRAGTWKPQYDYDGRFALRGRPHRQCYCNSRHWQHVLTDDFQLVRWQFVRCNRVGGPRLANPRHGSSCYGCLYRAWHPFSACALSTHLARPNR